MLSKISCFFIQQFFSGSVCFFCVFFVQTYSFLFFTALIYQKVFALLRHVPNLFKLHLLKLMSREKDLLRLFVC